MKPPLSEDLLTSIPAIAQYIYGRTDLRTQMRVRYQIERGLVPARKNGGRIESRRSWIDATYEHPTNLPSEEEDKEAGDAA